MAGTHDKLHDSAAAYLLGALPDLEQQAFERHVMACAACREEVERLRPAVEALPRSVTPLNPPEALKGRIMSAVADDEAAARAREGLGAPRESPLRRAGVAVQSAFRRARPVAAWASAAFLLAVGVAAGYAASEIGVPEERRVSAFVDEERLAQASGTLIVSEDEERAHLSVHGLPALPADDSNEIYQLWLVRGSEVIPSSLLSVGGDGSGVATVTSGIEDADAVWVTREPAGGARTPSEEPLMRINLG